MGELKKHSKGIPERFVFVDSKNNPAGKIYAAIRVVEEVKDPSRQTARVHTVDSVMIFVGKEPDLTGLEAEVTVQGLRYRVRSPAAVYVKAGLRHSYTLMKGSGLYQKIVLAEGGDYNRVTV